MAYLGNNNLPFDPTRTAAQPRDAERFSGNGSTTTYTLSRTLSNGAVDVDVYVENVKQEPITAYDVLGTSLVFTEAPPTGTYNIYVIYRNYQSGAQIIMPDGSVSYSKLANNLRLFTTDNLTPNGNNSVFTLTEPPADANTVFVTVDGMVQRAPVHYTTSGSTITFTSAPPVGSNVHVRHLGFRTTQTLTAIAANTTIPQPTLQSPNVTGGIFDSVTRLGVGVSANTSYGILNRYFGNSEIATQYGTGTLTGIGAYAATGGIFMDTTAGKIYPMQWDTSGRVSLPYQPAFQAFVSSSGTTYAAPSTIIFDNVTYNVAGRSVGYNASNGKYTAPVAGVYHFHFQTWKINSSNLVVRPLKNGSDLTDTFWMYNASAQLSESNTIQFTVYMSAGDTMEINVYAGTCGGDYCNFGGFLLG